ncbi:DnaJ like chaperone protein [Alkalispirillum mobile]|uniref:DnaJ like chaperone protein n=1 Tax=Alkalispirillum mobile TaxID=85925 RepID=A0A498BQ85_9GAMM|nr:TerB family tellurite resistance protein [Alkalispirillum mobile]RLK46293.1 DnaJ like chaperone protein [Alkalispirillum mobile]
MRGYWQSYLGRFLGLLSGWLLAGTWGLVPGLLLGWAADMLVRHHRFCGWAWSGCGMDGAERRCAGVLLALMGRLAKADGRVSEAEVAVTEAILGELNLTGVRRQRAITLFRRGRDGRLPLRALLRSLRRGLRARPEWRPRVLSALVRLAAADGPPDPVQYRLLVRVWRGLGHARHDLDQRLAGGVGQRRPGQPFQGGDEVARARALLGVAADAGRAEVRRAYRRGLSRHHPDRVQARGASAAEVRHAANRTRELREAWELLRHHHD